MDCSNAPLSHRPPPSSPNNTSEPLKSARVMTKSDIIDLLGSSSDEDDLPHDNDVADHPWDEWESSFKRAADNISVIGSKRGVEHHGKCGYISLRDQLDEKCEINKFMDGVKREANRCCEHYGNTGESYFVSKKAGRTLSAEQDHEEIKEHCNIPTTKNAKLKEIHWIRDGFFKAAVKKYKRTVFLYKIFTPEKLTRSKTLKARKEQQEKEEQQKKEEQQGSQEKQKQQERQKKRKREEQQKKQKQQNQKKQSKEKQRKD